VVSGYRHLLGCLKEEIVQLVDASKRTGWKIGCESKDEDCDEEDDGVSVVRNKGTAQAARNHVDGYDGRNQPASAVHVDAR
jgi:hypothetical protein